MAPKPYGGMAGAIPTAPKPKTLTPKQQRQVAEVFAAAGRKVKTAVNNASLGGPKAPNAPSAPKAVTATPAAPKAPKAPTTPTTPTTSHQQTTTSLPPVDDTAMWAATFDPARREIQRQQDLLGSQKEASTAAWDSYNKWAEDKRATAAGLLTTSQAAMATDAAARKAASEKTIAGYIDAARGGAGAPPQGADMAQATGSGAMAQGQAALATGQQANTDYRTALDKVNAQQLLDQQAIQKASATQGSSDINAAFAKASAALASKSNDLESQFGQAKVDKFYKDRQYGLDRETLDWTKSLQGTQQAENTRQFNVSTDLRNKQLSVQQQIAQGQLSFKQVQANIDNQYKAGKLTVQQRNSQIAAAKAGATSYDNTTKNALKVVGDTKKVQPDFFSVDTNAQGEYMRQGAAALMAAGIPLAVAMKHMAAMYGGRWSSQPTAVAETKKIFGGN